MAKLLIQFIDWYDRFQEFVGLESVLVVQHYYLHSLTYGLEDDVQVLTIYSCVVVRQCRISSFG